MGRWTEVSARSIITRNNGLVGAKQIWILRPGIKVLGAIDYLISKHGYKRIISDEVPSGLAQAARQKEGKSV